jgi:hypothetical protein
MTLSRPDPQNGLAPGAPARMAARIIESVDVEPAPLRIVLGSQALKGSLICSEVFGTPSGSRPV